MRRILRQLLVHFSVDNRLDVCKAWWDLTPGLPGLPEEGHYLVAWKSAGGRLLMRILLSMWMMSVGDVMAILGKAHHLEPSRSAGARFLLAWKNTDAHQ